jgi:D-glycero-D-manno-heptose 1,7-bisphosphate phosphatase
LEDFELYPGVVEAILKLKSADFLTIIVTNQPDVSRGWVEEERVHLINNKIRELISIDDIKICFHDNSSNCECRKPMPGMLLEAASEWDIDLSKSFMVGDRFGDVSAGVSAGCVTILVGEGDLKGEHPEPDYRASSLLEAAAKILSHS